MKRLVAALASASFVLAIGCSDYDFRLQSTLDERRYEKSLDKFLEAAPTKGTLKDDDFFIRPPKGLTGPTQAFSLTVVEPGKFDVENSFIDEKGGSGTSLHVVARVKRPKAAPTAKKAAAAPVESVVRGKFLDDVVELVKAAYSVELVPGDLKPKSEQHGNRVNEYKHKTLDLTTKQVEVYVYTEPNGVHEAAMIFEFLKDKSKSENMDAKIRYCLESFGVADRAKHLYAGTSDLDSGEPVAPGAPPPI